MASRTQGFILAEKVNAPSKADDKQVVELDGIVVALLPEFEQVHVRTEDGEIFAVTADTPGVDYEALQRGQHLNCFVARDDFPYLVKVELGR